MTGYRKEYLSLEELKPGEKKNLCKVKNYLPSKTFYIVKSIVIVFTFIFTLCHRILVHLQRVVL